VSLPAMFRGTAFSFDAAKHEYRVGSNVVPNCTSVLATGGLVPFALADADILERKSELGREVHKACHLHNIGKLGSCDSEVKPYLDSWILFKSTKKFTPLLSEFQAIGELNGMSYGMQIDCSGDLDGEDTVIEYKIGELYPHHGVQLAGYAIGLPHPRWSAPLARFASRKRIALQLRPGKMPHMEPYKERSDFYVFSSLLYVSTWKKQFKHVYKENA